MTKRLFQENCNLICYRLLFMRHYNYWYSDALFITSESEACESVWEKLLCLLGIVFFHLRAFISWYFYTAPLHKSISWVGNVHDTFLDRDDPKDPKTPPRSVLKVLCILNSFELLSWQPISSPAQIIQIRQPRYLTSSPFSLIAIKILCLSVISSFAI